MKCHHKTWHFERITLLFILLSILLVFASCMPVPERQYYKAAVKKMFYHGYNNYMEKAFPMDELMPLTCAGRQTWFSQALTLIDSLDTLAIIGDFNEFKKGVSWVISNLNFDRNISVSVFETNIRIIGGLLSAHLLIEAPPANFTAFQKPSSYKPIVPIPGYKGELLTLAKDLASRLLPAFTASKTGIPFGMVNILESKVHFNESELTSVAGGGTHLLEFGILTALTGETQYWKAALRAAQALYSNRSTLNLVGNHINIQTGQCKF